MIKMNFDNQTHNDDDQFINLLKEQIQQAPSEQLVENTLARLSLLQTEKKVVYMPLKGPLYLMMAIVLLMLLPFLIPMVSNGSNRTLLSTLLTYPISTVVTYAVWCWLSVLMVWMSLLLFSVPLRANPKSFKS